MAVEKYPCACKSKCKESTSLSALVLILVAELVDVFVYRLSEEEVSQEEDASGEVAKYQLQPLPHRDFHGLWEHLVYDADIKNDLLNYVYTAMLFSEKKVNPHVIGWNRVVLLHGPPGTGKTSLCKALAHKLSLRLRRSYLSYDLVEVNAHSLFSKWFSESGKLVMKMFADIRELAQEPEHFVCILVDEVESLTAARAKAMQGSEPSDSIRVVNAVLTELDKMKSFPNVLVLTTSNITGAIDEAFLDRADIVQYIGPPGLLARYDILASCVTELFSKGLIASSLAPLADGAIPDGNSTSTPILPVNVLLKIFDQANHSQNAFSSASILNAVDETSRKSVLINFLPLMLDYARIRSVAVLASTKLLQSALKLEGLSGRALRKLPFVAASVVLKGAISSLEQFVDSLAVAGAYVSARKQQ